MNDPTPRRPIGNYEIRFSIDYNHQSWAGLPPTCVSMPGHEKGFVSCAIVLPAYTAEDALLDFKIRLDAYKWDPKTILIESVVPTHLDRPEGF